MSRFSQLLDYIFGPSPKGRCVICGRETTNTKAGQFVCGYEDRESLNCGEVWNERNLRDIRDGQVDDDSYDWYRQEDYHDYKSYMKSYDWQVKADSLKRDARYRCQRCGKRKSRNKLHVHHKHYKTLFHERRGDVEVLCDKCHRQEHNL